MPAFFRRGNLPGMNLTAEHIAYRKKIGTLDRRPVIELATTGGLHLVVCAKANGVETLGAGPHRAVARHIAKKRHKGLVITDLSKADWIDPADFAHLLPAWESTTDRIRAVE